MSRCGHCPFVAELRCRGEHMPGFCAQMQPRGATVGGSYRPPPRRDGRIRAALLSPSLHNGGAETWARMLLAHTDPRRVQWIGSGTLYPSDPRLLENVDQLAPRADGRAAVQAMLAQADVVVAWAIAELAELVAPLERVPPIVMVSHSPPESDWAVWCYHHHDMSAVARWVAVSPLAVPTIPGPGRDQARVIANAVEPRRLAASRHRPITWCLPRGAKVAGFLGRLSAEKNVAAMVELARRLPEPWHVVVVGWGTDREMLDRALADEPGMRLRVVGPVTHPGEALAGFDVLVQPSRYESFGLSAAEALLAGRPVVSTPVGLALVFPDACEVVPHDDPDAMAAAVVSARPRDVSRLAEILSPARFGREWTELLEETAATHRPPAPRREIPDNVYTRVNACPYRECDTGCKLTICRAGLGDRDHGHRTTLDHCIQCIISGHPTKNASSPKKLG